ncbi:MAG: protein kinase [Proteobacteria bacterium]|nr:protein kinase [Pseudomonadota bacterium]
MNLICPKCRSALPVKDGGALLQCANCNLKIDRRKIDLSSGLSAVPLVRDLRGETVGSYDIIDLMGIGGTGASFKARRRDDGQGVVLKMLFYDLLRKGDFVARFKAEVGAMTRLDHPNILQVLDFGQDEDLYWLVYEFVEGVDLTHYLRSFNLKQDEARSIMSEVCQAVAYAHEQGIIHRNLKPSNIIMGRGQVKVMDFGLASLTNGDYRMSGLIRSMPALASFNYMSPEQRLNLNEPDERSDVYALGAILYHMLAGRPPIGAYTPPGRLRRGLNPKWDEVVARCLAPDPTKRYAGIDELTADMEAPRPVQPNGNRTPLQLVLLLLALLSIFVYLWPYRDGLWLLLRGESVSRGVPNRIQALVDPPKSDSTELPRSILLPTDQARLLLYAQPSIQSPVVGMAAGEGESLVMKEIRTETGIPWLYIQAPNGDRGWLIKP